jgi:peptidoglycan/xylan/chitin deacetylase (PgdA/CDA1 family)
MMDWSTRIERSALLLFPIALTWVLWPPANIGAQNASERSVVVTLDDLPYAGGPQRLEDATRATEAIVAALTDHAVPAVGFVTGVNVMVTGQVDARLDLLRRWRDAGVALGNHSYSHVSFHRTPIQDYIDDVTRGQVFPDLVMGESDTNYERYYRHPFNHAGNTQEARDLFAQYLSSHNVVHAPFTVEHADYMFNKVYVGAIQRGDDREAERIVRAYLDHLDTAFEFAETQSQETFGREIPQVLLTHANAINAACLDHMLGRLAARGYRFITLEEAMRDEAYGTKNGYEGNYGVSWLHRWRAGLGMESRLRDEPDPPEWLIDAYRNMAGR